MRRRESDGQQAHSPARRLASPANSSSPSLTRDHALHALCELLGALARLAALQRGWGMGVGWGWGVGGLLEKGNMCGTDGRCCCARGRGTGE